MNMRNLSGISVCTTYVICIAAWWAIVMLTQVASTCDLAFLVMLPFLIQIIVADVIGVFPWVDSQISAGNAAAVFGTMLAVTFFLLYWIGWFVEALNETPTIPDHDAC
ncbi:hypothetical protein [Pseudoduganella sp. GCM10020061]|uniref:hypothetical protein n=1 Tax=Pseudoduganella sp. GCM10020061 TaxID=3317345 RepID=UPI00364414D5